MLVARDWKDAAKVVLRYPFHTSIRFSKNYLPHPKDLGFPQRPDLRGLIESLVASYEVSLDPENQGVLHIQEFPSWYEVHRDKYSLNKNFFLHIYGDAPEISVPLTMMGIILIGVGISKSKKKK